MSSESKKIKGIVKELLSNALNAESSDVNVDIKRESKQIVITVKDDGSGMDSNTLEKAYQLLNQPRRVDLEDYYGGLAGNSPTSSGFNMVGMLVDKAEITSSKEEGTSVKVIIYKN